MAEIKSTIDLIMERTKNLSASPQERESYQRQEREKRLRGLVQRLLGDPGFTPFIQKKKNHGSAAEVTGVLKNALAGHVDPEADNERLFRYVNELVGTPEDRLRETLAACREEATSRKAVLAERQGKDLESNGITGSAVLPNPEADPLWKACREEMQAVCAKRFLAIIAG
jgi:hypothetical protein